MFFESVDDTSYLRVPTDFVINSQISLDTAGIDRVLRVDMFFVEFSNEFCTWTQTRLHKPLLELKDFASALPGRPHHRIVRDGDRFTKIRSSSIHSITVPGVPAVPGVHADVMVFKAHRQAMFFPLHDRLI